MNKIIIATILLSTSIHAGSFPANTEYQTCFTPSDNCTGMIVNEIRSAKKSINVQAYSFTSLPIEESLATAKSNNIDVNVILDKTQKNTSAQYFIEHGIPVWIDYKPRIAHNKVMIIDNETVITGSFNFTFAAQSKNAENVLIIHDKELAKTYLANWNKRQLESKEEK